MSKDKMTRYAFIEHMKDYMKKLLKTPLKADTDDFLHGFGIDAPSALKMLLKKTDPNDEYSAIVIRSERIKDNGYDDNGKRNKDTFEVKYKIPRKDFKKKLRNLYINLFEQNFAFPNTLEEGAWGYDILDNDSALDYQSEFAGISLNVLCSNVYNAMSSQFNDPQSLWAHLGVLVDFLKKYKDDEIQFNDKYTYAVELAKNAARTLFHNEDFTSSWSDPKKIKSSLKKVLKDVSLLEYQKDVMNIVGNQETRPTTPAQINEDGEGGAIGGGTMAGLGGATNAASSGQYTTPFKPKKGKSDVIKKNTIYITEEQAEYIKEATATSNAGNYQYDVPMGGDEDFYGEAMDHQDIMKKSFKGYKK